jgi:hypothetical protein
VHHLQYTAGRVVNVAWTVHTSRITVAQTVAIIGVPTVVTSITQILPHTVESILNFFRKKSQALVSGLVPDSKKPPDVRADVSNDVIVCNLVVFFASSKLSPCPTSKLHLVLISKAYSLSSLLALK